ncbi:MAG: hypothetical protein O2819_05935 [Planctomycetota bacterium]|nr:hypothetical protein [Planctomycetota bacterium]MDA1106389.1 hypothetical protein [Planctomycetota bacterium]
MARSVKEQRIDDLARAAQKELRASSWFEAERLALRALDLAHQARNWDAMAGVVLPLQEARRQRMQRAIDCNVLRVVESNIPEEPRTEPGCYLVQPPQVGADARRLRLAALHREVPVLVLCREPVTRLGQVPVVAVGPETIRARVAAVPKKGYTLPWFLSALRDLGDAAIAGLDTGLEWHRQVQYLVSALDAVSDHEELHQILHEVCAKAARVGASGGENSHDPLDDELALDDGSAAIRENDEA